MWAFAQQLQTDMADTKLTGQIPDFGKGGRFV